MDDATPSPPTCKCGYTRDHLMVSRMPKYSPTGSFWVFFFGVSTEPFRIDFQCRVCGEVFDRTADPAELKRYI